MSRREFSGRSAAEAAIKACEELGVSRSALKYEVVSETGAGLEKRVVIAVNTEQVAASGAQSPFEDRPSGGGERHERREPRDDRGGDRDRPAEGGYHARHSDDDRGNRRDRHDRGGRGGDRHGGRGGRDRGGRGGDRHGRHDRGEGDQRRREEESIESLLNLETLPQGTLELKPEVPGGERATKARTVLAEMLQLSTIKVAPTLVQDGPEEIIFDLRGDDAAKAIGKKGETLLAMQFLVNRMISRTQEDSEQHIVLDAANYRTRRRDALANLATKLATRAMEERKVVRLSPMSAHDRRIFHITLHEKPGVTTRSEGEGLYRPLLIIPTE